MSNATYSSLWGECMAALTEQVHLEDPSISSATSEVPAAPQASITQAFQHYSCLYIKYLQIFKRLENCYDSMVHPQKHCLDRWWRCSARLVVG